MNLKEFAFEKIASTEGAITSAMARGIKERMFHGSLFGRKGPFATWKQTSRMVEKLKNRARQRRMVITSTRVHPNVRIETKS